MDKQRWRKIESILDEALTLDNSRERKFLVSERCGNDEKLYQEVILLLTSIESANQENFLED